MNIHEADKILDTFRQFLDTDNEKLIEKFTKKQLIMVSSKILSEDHHRSSFKAIQKRIQEFEQEKDRKRDWVQKIIFNILNTLVLGVIATIITSCLISHFNIGKGS